MSRLSLPDDMADRWAAYHAAPSDATRNRVAEPYLPTVRLIAERFHATIRAGVGVEVDDLYQEAAAAMLDCVARFRPDRGTLFHSFFASRVRGAMVDYIRERDTGSRLDRKRATALSRARRDLTREAGGRPPTPAEVAARLGVGPALYGRYAEAEGRCRPARSLNYVHARNQYDDGTGRDMTADSRVPDPEAESPHAAAERSDFWSIASRGLGRADALIVCLYFRHGHHMAECGRALGISESRVSQRITALLPRLRDRRRGLLDALPAAA